MLKSIAGVIQSLRRDDDDGTAFTKETKKRGNLFTDHLTLFQRISPIFVNYGTSTIGRKYSFLIMHDYYCLLTHFVSEEQNELICDFYIISFA